MRNIFSRLQEVDRRWLYVLIFAAVLIPFLTGLELKAGTPSPATTDIYDYINRLAPGSVILISVDYSPASMAELEPMAKAVVRHAFACGHRVIAMALFPEGAMMINRVLDEVAPEMNKTYATDYVNAGFKPGGLAVILGMGKDIIGVFEDTDAEGNGLSNMPVMAGVKSYDDIDLMIDFAAGNIPYSWITYAHEQYQQEVGVGVTAVMATDFYTFWKSGQIVGLINGLKGAAEYEELIQYPGWGMAGMSSQSIAHALIIFFIILGNIGYFLARRRP